jgi:hypothetical protein
MRNKMVVLSLVAALALTASAGFAGANVGMRINIPFDFYAGDQSLPAGEYTFAMESGLVATGSKVTVHSQKGTGLCFLITRPGTDEGASRLLFNRYGNKHFLTSVSIQGFMAGVKTTKLERELRTEIQNQKNVVIVAQK